MKFKVCVFHLLAILLLTSTAESSVIFSKRYLRSDGVPNVYHDTFVSSAREGLIQIENGTENVPSTMISSMEIWLNGEQIFGENDLNVKTTFLEKNVNFLDTNSIEIVLKSKPDSYLKVIFISDEITDETYSAYAHKIIRNEQPLEKVVSNSELNVVMLSSIILTCNIPEDENSTFPTTAVPLNGGFYVFTGVPSDLPKDPGTAGNATIYGIDSDGDCIRDDIERYIVYHFPGEGNRKLRKNLYEYAKWMGYFLNNISSNDAKEAYKKMEVSAHCVQQIMGGYSKTKPVLEDLFAEFHNTHARSLRYIDNMFLIGGWTTLEDLTITCQ